MKRTRPILIAGVLALAAALAGCAAEAPAGTAATTAAVETAASLTWENLTAESTLPLSYATEFRVERCQSGYRKITIGEDSYLVVPEGAEVPEGTPEDVTVLRQPLGKIYLNATSAIDIFRKLDAMGTLRFSAFTQDKWYVPEAVEAMESGAMVYAGKYSAPDYELLVAENCDLAIESTMIYHKPEVQEQLESLGIPVLVERSSYESDPLGRMEWIKLYGAILGKEEEAEAYFNQMMEDLSATLEQPATGKTVAYFYIMPEGGVMVRKGGDYIARCIELAGGSYVFADLAVDGSSQATATIQMEEFYDTAKDADLLIYNSSMGSELETMDELLEQSELLADFKAVQEGNVWCTSKQLFQESLGIGGFIQDIHAILTEEAPETQYLHKLAQ